MADKRISINSLLNSQDQAPRPRSGTPSTVESYADSRSRFQSRENTQTPATIHNSPSPTISQRSISSNTSSTTGRAPSRRSSTSSDSSTTPQHHSMRHATLYSPYDQSQRPKNGKGSRQFRPSYDLEESYFIWYHRLDLNLDWSQVTLRFNNHFKQKRSGCQGFQCKFYRFLQEHGLPSVRERAKDPNAPKNFALRTWKPDVWYPWMAPGATDYHNQR